MNWGAPFIVAFIILLVASATELSVGAAGAANGIAVYGFYALVVGIVLQIASYVKYGEAESNPVEAGAPGPSVERPRTGLSRRTREVAVAAVVLILLAGVVLGYPALVHRGASLSGCSGPRNDGMVFIGTYATVSIDICGQSFLVNAGAGGGLTYAYRSGLVNFTAPSSVNGSNFDFWSVSLAGSHPERVNSTTLDLNLPAGLTAQDTLIILYYTAPHAAAVSTTVAASTSSTPSIVTSTTSVTITSTVTTTVTSVSTITTTSTSTVTAAPSCRGDDGDVFLATNLNITAPIDICGEQVSVGGGVGGGLDYNYHAGAVTFTAPLTVGGQAFGYWVVLTPSQKQQVMSNQLTIDLPAGYSQYDTIIEAFYG